jgi:HK97 family phage major capsid protein
MKTFTEQKTDLENTIATKRARMEEIMTKASEEGRSTDDEEAREYDDLDADCTKMVADVGRLEKAASFQKLTPVDGSSTKSAQASRASVQVKNTQKLEPGIAFTRHLMCELAAKGDKEKALRIAQQEYPEMESLQKGLALSTEFERQGGLEAAMQLKAAVAAGTTTNATWVGNLVQYQDYAGDFVDFLRPQTILGKFGTGGVPSLNRVPFNVRIAGQTSGGAGYWVGEGAAKPLTSFDFSTTTLRWTKVANIAVLTQESIRFSNPSAEMLVRNALAAALIERMDIDFIDPGNAGTANVKPASITNGVTPISPSGSDADALRRDLRALWAPFIAANNPPTTAVYIMTATMALAISLMQNPLGQSEFPGLNMNGGTLMGVPVIVSEYLDNSAGSSGGLLILANARDIWLADDGQVTVDASDQASLQMDNAPTMNSTTPTPIASVSMWQTNSVAFRAERFVNWAKRRATAVSYIDGANYG